MLAAAVIRAVSCSWSDKDSEQFYALLIVGTAIGAIFGTICTVLTALPLCCGIMKPQAKIISGVCMAIGIFICFIPAITGKAQADAAVEKMCERCATEAYSRPCTDKERTDAKDQVSALGIFVAYLHGFGFVVVILGVTASVMACCICCKCCKMKDDVPTGPAPGMVIGQPVVDANNVKTGKE